MAYHFGYFFYCPGCRNKDNISGFLKHMRHFGIFIPKRRVPGFAESSIRL